MIWEGRDRAGFMSIQAVLSHRAYDKKDATRNFMHCCHHHEVLNNFIFEFEFCK